jgi:membrane protease YdiL (CAAX protease family)
VTLQTRLLTIWLLLTSALIALNFAARPRDDQPHRDLFFHWSSVAGWVLNALLLLVPALLLARGDRVLSGFQRPHRLLRTTGIAVVGVVGTAALDVLISQTLGDPGREQGIAPTHWQPGHAAAFAANLVGIAVLVPLSEETFFRGVGFGLVSRVWSVPVAVLVTGSLFGLAHGLLLGFLPLAFLGASLALMRATSGSTLPGVLLHGLYNASAVLLSLNVL